MRPILFVWHGIVLRSFHVMVYAALLVTVFLTVHFAQADRLNPDRTALAVLLLFIPGFAGARLLYAARHWDHFQSDPPRILRRSEGGLSLYGGLFGVFAVAKGGWLLNGCCYGHETGHWWGVDLPDDRGMWRRRFPSQLMEMAWAAVVLALMLAWRGFSPPSGVVACGALALHAAGRIFLQKLRDEGPTEDATVGKTCAVLIAAALLTGLVIWLG